MRIDMSMDVICMMRRSRGYPVSRALRCSRVGGLDGQMISKLEEATNSSC